MMNWLKTFFEENPNFASAMRLIYIFGSAWLMAFVTVSVFTGKCTFVEGCQYFVIIFGLLQGGKTLSKHLENNSPQEAPPAPKTE